MPGTDRWNSPAGRVLQDRKLQQGLKHTSLANALQGAVSLVKLKLFSDFSSITRLGNKTHRGKDA